MRLLIGPAQAKGTDVAMEELHALYEPPRRPWLRVNMVTSLDGAATGGDGKSGTLNNEADHAVFESLRTHADAIVVGAGTARTEGYGPAECPIVLVTRRAEVPEKLQGAPRGSVLVATSASSPGLAAAREQLGTDNVLVVGDDGVDLVRLRDELVSRGWTSILSEGGPGLLGDLLAAGVVDELCVTIAPTAVAGDAGRIAHGPPVDASLDLTLLLEAEGTLLGRWAVRS